MAQEEIEVLILNTSIRYVVPKSAEHTQRTIYNGRPEAKSLVIRPYVADATFDKGALNDKLKKQ